MTPWLWLMIAGGMEVGFTTFLKLMDNNPSRNLFWGLCFVLCASISFWCMSKAMLALPMGTVYAVWTGMGALGTAIVGVIWFGDPLSLARGFFLGLLVLSIVGLKWFS